MKSPYKKLHQSIVGLISQCLSTRAVAKRVGVGKSTVAHQLATTQRNIINVKYGSSQKPTARNEKYIAMEFRTGYIKSVPEMQQILRSGIRVEVITGAVYAVLHRHILHAIACIKTLVESGQIRDRSAFSKKMQLSDARYSEVRHFF